MYALHPCLAQITESLRDSSYFCTRFEKKLLEVAIQNIDVSKDQHQDMVVTDLLEGYNACGDMNHGGYGHWQRELDCTPRR